MDTGKRKFLVMLAVVLVFVLLCAGCRKKDGEEPGSEDQTGNVSTEDTKASAESVPDTADESKPVIDDGDFAVFDGNKDSVYLTKNGLTAYESAFAELGEVEDFVYVGIAGGAEIYCSGTFVGWFAAWDFSDVTNLNQGEVISDDNIDSYIQRHFGGAYSMGCDRTGRTELKDGVSRYDFEAKMLVRKGDEDWLAAEGLCGSEEAALERGTCTLKVSAYYTDGSDYGYILCLDKSGITEEQAGELADAVSFMSNSFTAERPVPKTERNAQALYLSVEERYPYAQAYLEMCQWFEDYNGEKVQRIAGTKDDNYSPAVCPDIVYYRASTGESLNDIVNAMFKAIMDPLTQESDVRPFTVTAYFLDEQQILVYEGRENMWLLPYLNGYYAYEGTDFVSMETAKNGGQTREGLVSLFRQGSAESFQYVLVKEGSVFRLQRAQDMGLEVDSGMDR